MSSLFNIKRDPKQLKIREKEHAKMIKQDKKNQAMEKRISEGKGRKSDFASAESYKKYKQSLKNK